MMPLLFPRFYEPATAWLYDYTSEPLSAIG